MTELRIVRELPPNFGEIRKHMKIPNINQTIFCYGSNVYTLIPGKIPKELMDHELVHSQRQGDDPEGWWAKYLVDPEFRLAEEIPAHRAEYQCLMGGNRHYRRKALKLISQRLCGPLYGNMISQKKAEELIAKGLDF